MKRTLILIFFALLLPTIAISAEADVEVSPGDSAPSINLNADRWKRPHSFRMPKSKQAPNPDDVILFSDLRCRDLPNGTTQCFGMGFVTPPAEPDQAELTPADILRAVREIGLPSLKINIQPGGETLVNFDTIFYAQPQPFQRSVTLLGYDIDVTATPARFIWHHGDGSSHTTGIPGRPYPSKDVTYRYDKAANNLHPSVDVTYAVRFRVDGGAWQNLSETLLASGPTDELDVREAAPVLTGG